MPDALLPDDSVRRWGERVLVAGLVGGVLLVGAVAWKAPDVAPLLPLGLVALLGAFVLFRHHRLNFIVWLGGLALLFSSDEGVQLHEALYGLYFYGYLAHWYGRRVFAHRCLVYDLEDKTALLLLVLGLVGGIGLGLAFDANLVRLRGEVLSFSVLAIYFPVKEFAAREKHGPLIVFALLAWLGVYITLENIYLTQRTFAQATELWQIADVRMAGRELQLTFALVLLLSACAIVQGRRHVLSVLLLLGLVFSGLALTKSRAFWVAFAFGAAILFALLDRASRRRLMLRLTTASTAAVVVAILLIGPYLVPVLFGILNRLATLNSAATDISLLNRLAETAVVRARIADNPVLGHGFGTEYSYFRLIEQATMTWSYIHNGYMAVWYKFGLWGVALFATFWGRALWLSLRAGRTVPLPPLYRALALGVAACLICMILPAYTSSVFIEDDKLSAFTLVTALGVGIYQRSSLVSPAKRAARSSMDLES